MVQLLDAAGQPIVDTTIQDVLDPIVGEYVELSLYLGRQLAPGVVPSDERSQYETMRYGGRVLPILTVKFPAEDARKLEELIQGSNALLLAAEERDGERQRTRWFLVGSPLMHAINKASRDTQEVS